MKHFIHFLSVAFLLLFSTGSFAQPGNGMPQKEITPKEIAGKKADHLKKDLSLTEKQRKKVYKLYLNEAKAMESQSSSSDFRPMGPPPGGDGRGGHMGPPPGRDGSGRGGDIQGERPSRRGGAGVAQESEENIANREKKMRKILSEEQYDQWVELEKHRRHKEFQDKLLRDSEKPLRN